MNILFYLHRFPGDGGIEKVTEYLANYFALEFNYNVSIIACFRQNEFNINNLDDKVNLYYLPVSNEILHLANIFELKKIIIQNKIDFIIFQDSYAPIEKLLYKLDQDLNVRVITVEHNTPDSYKSIKHNWQNLKLNSLRNIIKKIIYPYSYAYTYFYTKKRVVSLLKYSDKYIVLSKSFIPVLQKSFKIKYDTKIIAINNPLTAENNFFFTEKKENICLFVGRLTRQKGVDKLLKIWKMFVCKNPDWKLQIIGDGFMLKDINNYINEDKIENVELLGFQKNMNSYYEKASILCVTSIFEGWGLIIPEAMSYGVVPIAFHSYSSVYDLIDDSVNGCLVKPFDINDYVEKLHFLANDKVKRHAFAIASLEKSKVFDIKIIGENWKSVFEEQY